MVDGAGDVGLGGVAVAEHMLVVAFLDCGGAVGDDGGDDDDEDPYFGCIVPLDCLQNPRKSLGIDGRSWP